MTKDYKIDIKIKNNLLYKSMFENGFNTVYDLAKASGVAAAEIYRILNLKTTLYNTRRNKIRPVFLKLSEILKQLPEDLIPKNHWYEPLKKNKASIEMDLKDISYLLPGKNPDEILFIEEKKQIIQDALCKLTQREKYIIQNRFGLVDECTLEELGKNLKISKERVRSIEAAALRKLKKDRILKSCTN